MKFEEALEAAWNGKSVRRAVWAHVPDYTRETPPLQFYRTWRVFASQRSLINGWGGSVGGAMDGDPIRDGMLYTPTNDDRTATDWELVEKAHG